jgi:hypothetical protein
MTCYLRIYLYARASNQRHRSFRNPAKNGSSVKRMKKCDQEALRRKKSIQLALNLFISFGLFALCWWVLKFYGIRVYFSKAGNYFKINFFKIQRIPYGIVVSTGFDDEFSMGLHAFVTLMAHINSCLNPYIYLMNQTFRKSFACLFIKRKSNNTSSIKTGS